MTITDIIPSCIPVPFGHRWGESCKYLKVSLKKGGSNLITQTWVPSRPVQTVAPSPRAGKTPVWRGGSRCSSCFTERARDVCTMFALNCDRAGKTLLFLNSVLLWQVNECRRCWEVIAFGLQDKLQMTVGKGIKIRIKQTVSVDKQPTCWKMLFPGAF